MTTPSVGTPVVEVVVAVVDVVVVVVVVNQKDSAPPLCGPRSYREGRPRFPAPLVGCCQKLVVGGELGPPLAGRQGAEGQDGRGGRRRRRGRGGGRVGGCRAGWATSAWEGSEERVLWNHVGLEQGLAMRTYSLQLPRQSPVKRSCQHQTIS